MVSIVTQKKIMWIPFVNVVNFMFFLFNCRNIKIGTRAWWMLFVYCFGHWTACSLVAILLEYVIPPDSLIITFYNLYLFPVVICHGMIKYQEKYLDG